MTGVTDTAGKRLGGSPPDKQPLASVHYHYEHYSAQS